jgi:hypothetical protein
VLDTELGQQEESNYALVGTKKGCQADGRGRMKGWTDEDDDDGCWVNRDLDAL